MVNAASKPGLAFVGWTRATTWAKVAFHSLPPLEDFLAIRLQTEFKVRAAFEASADALHDDLLSKRGVSEEMHIRAHQEHLGRVLLAREGRAATPVELDDIRVMLSQRGVAALSDSVRCAAASDGGKESSSGLWRIVSAFREDTRAKQAFNKKKARARRSSVGDERSACTIATEELLKEHGYPRRISKKPWLRAVQTRPNVWNIAFSEARCLPVQ